ncbi:MAG: hypothetical protein HYV47_01280 [Candidatus Nealsonbacteria bacterium]|nr:hypothetical protein [Candidatus Nealsonbacteria bacterium]
MVKQKTEGQVLKMAVDRLERAKSDSQKYTVLGDMDKKLPDGKGKRFLRDVSIFTEAAEKILRDKNNLEDLEKLEEAAKYLETALRKFNKNLIKMNIRKNSPRKL